MLAPAREAAARRDHVVGFKDVEKVAPTGREWQVGEGKPVVDDGICGGALTDGTDELRVGDVPGQQPDVLAWGSKERPRLP